MKIEVGQYYRNRRGQLCKVVEVTDENQDCVLVVCKEASGWYSSLWFQSDGTEHGDDFESELDLVEHLPDCDGFDWKPAKWRKATAADIAKGPVECRVRDSEEATWIAGTLVGYVHGTSQPYVAKEYPENIFRRRDNWFFCEVRDA
jgi:hypothetical protein